MKWAMAASVAAQVAQRVCYSDDRVQAVAEQGLLEIPTSYIRPAEERPNVRDCSLTEVTSDYGSLPVIDLAEGGPDVVAQVGQACSEWGFFQVVLPFLSPCIADNWFGFCRVKLFSVIQFEEEK